jgi:Rhodopirellula transposase DDE domain
VPVKALDHDFHPELVVTPFGFLLPKYGELFISMVRSRVTSDCIVDQLQHLWTSIKPRFPDVSTLLLDQDNGPENNSRRTQYIKRIIEFADLNQVNIRLAYYPPYHSKYNPIERTWGALENYWNGTLLDSVQTVVEMASAMRWKGKHPVVRLVTDVYEKGVRLTKEVMATLEQRLRRAPTPNLAKYFIDIPFMPATQ